jgi:putative membrane protein
MSSATRYRSYSIFSTAVLMALASASASAAPAEARSNQTPDPSDPQIAAIVVASNETPGAADAGATGTAGTAGAGSGQLSDAQIAAIAVAANKVDVEAGRAARKKTKNAKVRTFANDMIRDHTSANKQAAALVKKLGVTPEENDTSRGLTQGGEDNLANLKSMKGKEFDRAYAEHEVAYHQQVLDALDQKLIPGAQNAELKSLLQSVRAVIAQHLDHATALAKALSK